MRTRFSLYFAFPFSFFFYCVVFPFGFLQKTALAASEILRNERAVLTEVLDNNRCLLEFMDMMDSHKKVSADEDKAGR